MYRDVEEMLTRELRGVADHVTVPPLPELPTAPPPSRLVWQPMLVAAALVLVALATVASLLRMDDGRSPQPAPQPTNVVTDDATDSVPDAVPNAAPTVPYILDGVLHVGDRSFPGYEYLRGGRNTGWLVGRQDFTFYWGNNGRPNPLSAPTEQPPSISPNGEYVAYITTEGEMNGFETDPAGEGMGLPAEASVRDEDGVGTRTVVTDDGWVIASGRGVGLLWKPFVDGSLIDLSRTAPGQVVWQATAAGLVVVDGTGDARDPGQGRVYLADLSADGGLTPVADLPNFSLADVAGSWVAWVQAGVLGGEVLTFDEIRVRRLDGGQDGVLTPPDGWKFYADPFVFEDNQFLVATVTDGSQQRMVRCSPGLRECVLLDTP